MRLNYKRIGDFIQQIKQKNTEGEFNQLLGINIDKYFMPSVANVIGTDMTKYKVVKRNQFACNRMHVGRDYRIPIALSKNEEPFIVSPAYTVFEIVNTSILLPEYLMMWFSRSEFDREAWFHTDADVRGGLPWDLFCDMELPVPSIEKQREIVKEYNTIVNRISLNETLNQKLEETAQALYKHWFVDFEFPNADGKPYKSSGGKMEFNEELDMEVPEGWENTNLGGLLVKSGYVRGPFGSALKVSDMRSSGVPVYEQQHILDEHRNFRYFIDEEKYNKLKRFTVKPLDILISCSGVNLGKLSYVKTSDLKGIINQALLILRVNPIRINPICIKLFLSSKEGARLLVGDSGGSAIPNIAKRDVIQAIPFLLPTNEVSHSIGLVLNSLDTYIVNNRNLIEKLEGLVDLILSKMSKVETNKVLV